MNNLQQGISTRDRRAYFMAGVSIAMSWHFVAGFVTGMCVEIAALVFSLPAYECVVAMIALWLLSTAVIGFALSIKADHVDEIPVSFDQL